MAAIDADKSGEQSRVMVRLPEEQCERIHEGEHPLKVIREFRRIDIADLAKHTGYSASWLEKVEANKRQLSLEQADVIASALDINQFSILDPVFSCSFDIAGVDEDWVIRTSEEEAIVDD